MSRNTVQVVPAKDLGRDSQRPYVLVVDDDERLRSALARALRTRGYRVASVQDGSGALRAVKRQAPDLVLLDVHLPDSDGLQVMRQMKSLDPAIPTVLLTGFGTVASAVDAMRLGAHDYLEKPLRPSRLLEVVERVFRQVRPPEFASLDDRRPTLRGESRGMQRVRRAIAQAAFAGRTPVLIEGEGGTGKEFVARAIHEASAGGSGPFISIDCAALTDSQIETGFLGRDRSVARGANPEGKSGLLAAARGGTLFLDEVAEIGSGLQGKLLRALQECGSPSTGGGLDRGIGCRVIASTHRALQAAVEEGKFRRDLFYSLNVLTIEVPPLRERPEDILPLGRFFFIRCLTDLGKNLIGFSVAAEAALREHDWPGNVRELRNVVEHAVLVCPRGEIGLGHLGLERSRIRPRGSRCLPLQSFRIREMEKELIGLVLAETAGNISAAARELGINRSTLYAKIKEHGLSVSKS